MALFDFLKKKKPAAPTSSANTGRSSVSASSPASARPGQASDSDFSGKSKDDIIKMILQQQAQRSPSDIFVSGTVFDLSRSLRDMFLEALRSNNAFQLLNLFQQCYAFFLDHPEQAGAFPGTVKKVLNDTNPAAWNADIIPLLNGDLAALLFMPVQDISIDARIVGIVFSTRGDGYYYCMLPKGEASAAEVVRNKAMLGIETVGSVSGRGFELMDRFIACIKKDFYR